MRIIELLESYRADLYHGTTLNGAEQIILSNVMKARMPVRSTDIPTQYKGKTSTVSFSRSKKVAINYSDYHNDHPSDVAVVLIIDQDKLKQLVGNRLQSYDDIRTSAYNASYSRWNRGNNVPSYLYRKDVEEIVFGNIVNINKCIKQIIIIPTTGRDSERNIKRIRISFLLNDPRTIVQYKEKTYSPQEYMNLITNTA